MVNLTVVDLAEISARLRLIGVVWPSIVEPQPSGEKPDNLNFRIPRGSLSFVEFCTFDYALTRSLLNVI